MQDSQTRRRHRSTHRRRRSTHRRRREKSRVPNSTKMEPSPPTKRHREQKKPRMLVAGTGTNTDEDEEEPGEIIAKRSRHPRQATATGTMTRRGPAAAEKRRRSSHHGQHPHWQARHPAPRAAAPPHPAMEASGSTAPPPPPSPAAPKAPPARRQRRSRSGHHRRGRSRQGQKRGTEDLAPSYRRPTSSHLFAGHGSGDQPIPETGAPPPGTAS